MTEVFKDEGSPWGITSTHFPQDSPSGSSRLGHRLAPRQLSHGSPHSRPTRTAPTPIAKKLTSPFRTLLRVVKQRTLKKAHPEPPKSDTIPSIYRAPSYVTPLVSLASSSTLAPSSNRPSSSTTSLSVPTPSSNRLSSSFTLDSGYAPRLASTYGVSPWLSNCTQSSSSLNPPHVTCGCPHIQHFRTTFQQPCVCDGQPVAVTHPPSPASRCGVQLMFSNRVQPPPWPNPPIHLAFDSPHPRRSETTFSHPYLSDGRPAEPCSRPKAPNRQWTGHQELDVLSSRSESPMPLESSLSDGFCSIPQEAPRLIRMPDPQFRYSSGGINPSMPLEPPLPLYQPLMLHDTRISPLPTRYDDETSESVQPDLANFMATNSAEVATSVYGKGQQCEESRFFDDTFPPVTPESSSSIYLPGYATRLQGSEVYDLSIESSPSTKPTSTSKPLPLMLSTESPPPVSFQPSPDESLAELEEGGPPGRALQNAQDSLPREHERISMQRRSEPNFLLESLTLAEELSSSSTIAQCPGFTSPHPTSFAHPSSILNLGSSGSQLGSLSAPSDPTSAPIDLSIGLCPQPSAPSAGPKLSLSTCTPRHVTRLTVPKICEHPAKSSPSPASPLLPQCTPMSSTDHLLSASASKPLPLVLSTELFRPTSLLPSRGKPPAKLLEGDLLEETRQIVHRPFQQRHEVIYPKLGPRITALQELSILVRLLRSIPSGPHPDRADSSQTVHLHARGHRQPTGLHTTAFGWRWIVCPNHLLSSGCIGYYFCFSPQTNAAYIPTRHGSLVIGLIAYSRGARKPPLAILGSEHDDAPPTSSDRSETLTVVSISPGIPCKTEYHPAAPFLPPIDHLLVAP
ncbi:hypothetical protein RSAG8_13668, partial [Rhizoctonia solani AG-8 WAC10335]